MEQEQSEKVGNVDGRAGAAFVDKVFPKSCADMSEIPDGAVDCIITSPPYENIRNYSKLPGDVGNYQANAFIERMEQPLRECYRVLNPKGSAFFNFYHQLIGGFASPTIHKFPALLESVGFRIIQPLYWLKTNPHPTSNDRLLKSSVETVYHVGKEDDFYANKDAVRRPHLSASKDTRPWKYNPKGADPGNAICPAFIRLNRMSLQEVFARLLDLEANIITSPKTNNQGSLHLGKMPDPLAEWLILYGSKPVDIVLDPFIGSGTTARQAKAWGRHFCGFEIVPEYARLSESRIAEIKFGQALEGEAAATTPATSLSSPKPKKPNLATCKNCGNGFEKKTHWQECCCDDCRYEFHNKRKKQ